MIIVTGMHRSGTSLTARLLHGMGLNFGNLDTMIAADRWNPEGYLEQHQIVSLNRYMTEGWLGRLAYLRPPSKRRIIARSYMHRDSLMAVLADYSQHCIKDPRFCLTLDGWLTAGLNSECKLVVSLRHPIGVTDSLVRRNKIPRWLALYLWRVHYERLLETLRNHSELNVHYVFYSALASPDEEVRQLETNRLMAFAGTDNRYTAEELSLQIKAKNEQFIWAPRSDLASQAAKLWSDMTGLMKNQ